MALVHPGKKMLAIAEDSRTLARFIAGFPQIPAPCWLANYVPDTFPRLSRSPLFQALLPDATSIWPASLPPGCGTILLQMGRGTSQVAECGMRECECGMRNAEMRTTTGMRVRNAEIHRNAENANRMRNAECGMRMRDAGMRERSGNEGGRYQGTTALEAAEDAEPPAGPPEGVSTKDTPERETNSQEAVRYCRIAVQRKTALCGIERNPSSDAEMQVAMNWSGLPRGVRGMRRRKAEGSGGEPGKRLAGALGAPCVSGLARADDVADGAGKALERGANLRAQFGVIFPELLHGEEAPRAGQGDTGKLFQMDGFHGTRRARAALCMPWRNSGYLQIAREKTIVNLWRPVNGFLPRRGEKYLISVKLRKRVCGWVRFVQNLCRSAGSQGRAEVVKVK